MAFSFPKRHAASEGGLEPARNFSSATQVEGGVHLAPDSSGTPDARPLQLGKPAVNHVDRDRAFTNSRRDPLHIA